MASAKSVFRMAPQVIATGILVTLIFSFEGPWNAIRFIGLAITVFAAVAFLTARYQLGESFSVNPQAKHLVTSGIYSRIRNPLYVFSTLMILGAVIAYQRPVFLLIPAALVIVQGTRAHREARVLEAAFGDAYREYRKRTWF
jgi:protein-S-isoprenylcysteine O-methyltransferase Ste14